MGFSSEEGLLVEDLSKEYPTPAEPLTVLRDVGFALGPGETLAVTGPSGSGKSTLLYIVGALETPTRGRIRLAGEDPRQLDEVDLARFRNRRIGFIFQDHCLLPQLSALENVLTPTLAEGADRAAEERARTLLERVGLANRMAHRPAELSGGERQRVAIARALVQRPLLLLADEPTGNLDRRTSEVVADLLLELQRESQTILVLVTHSGGLAARLARRAELVDGRLEFNGDRSE